MLDQKLLVAPSGQMVDVIYTEAANRLGTIVIYPCIGGTTRMYAVPRAILRQLGYSVIEFHPPAHGRSEGQMTMGIGLDLFQWVLRQYPADGLFVGLGHSAGANALLQYNMRPGRRPFDWHFLLQPVFDFADSARYMYATGQEPELFNAIKRWVKDESRLRSLLLTPAWLDAPYWHDRRLRETIDGISQGIMLGEFLEDFYIRNNDVSSQVAEIGRTSTVCLSLKDRWYDPQRTNEMCRAHSVETLELPHAIDHFLSGVWPDVWRVVLGKLPSLRPR